jgi:NAD(P)-dependent dehydrogenase (short-subunit alcohol dehydrogenase family)
MCDLQDKKVVVLGGSGLIGSAVCRGFKKNEANVVNVDLEDNADIVSDIHTPYAYQAIMEEVKRIDVLVDCTYPQSLLLADSWVWFINEAAKDMSQGCIILFSSIYGQRGPDKKTYENTNVETPELWYSFFKGGVEATTRWIASVYGPNVRCNCIAPGGVWDHHKQPFVRNYSKKVPMNRMAMPMDLVYLTLFLASSVSEYITGQTINCDGGIASQL